MAIKENHTKGRWAIFFDIEGFAHLEESKMHNSFDLLISTIYKIGTKVYPNSPERLFVHHIGGDSIIIVSDFSEKDLSRPISIAIVLQRVLIANNYIGKAGISIGDFADISSCWPKFYNLVKKNLPKTHTELGSFPEQYDRKKIHMGNGLITLIPVLGTSLIKSYKAQNKGPSGPNIIIPFEFNEKIPSKYSTYKLENNYSLIYWIDASSEIINEICEKINKPELKDFDFIKKNFDKYLSTYRSNGVSKEWIKNANKLRKNIKC